MTNEAAIAKAGVIGAIAENGRLAVLVPLRLVGDAQKRAARNIVKFLLRNGD
ncbi:hypothetical protein [Candidatus Electronema sp. JC]|uniref:hypothetical protein n=1 Tax=Candidatus Electronema sp. JC TaxID=3401570 RepID=UPI003B430DB5